VFSSDVAGVVFDRMDSFACEVARDVLSFNERFQRKHADRIGAAER
jgi:hypothetical protein